MGDPESMAIVHRRNDLLKTPQRLGRCESSPRTEVIEELPAFNVLEDEIEFGGGFPDVVETHDVGMFDELHYDDFALDTEEHVFGAVGTACDGGAVKELLFGDDLDGGVLACLGVSCDADATCGWVDGREIGMNG